MLHGWVLSLLLSANPAQAPALRPADLVRAALADARSSPDAAYFRYFDLGGGRDSQEIAARSGLLRFTLNSLSGRRLFADLAAVPGTSGRLVRCDLRSLGLAGNAWEEFGKSGSGPQQSLRGQPCPEPYFHYQQTVTYQEVEEKLVDCEPYQQGGQWYRQKWIKVPGEKKTKTQLSQGPWLPAAETLELVQRTGSEFPTVRADWFLANALLPPAYQRFLGVKTLADFQKRARYRERDDDLAVRGNLLVSSEVALHNRALLRTPTVLGYYWRSLDYQSSVGEADVLANVLSDKSDASEIIASAPNGLQQYLVVDGQGKVIDFADPNIAIDRSTAWDNKLVWTGYSCIVCHAKGLKDFQDDVRRLADVRKRVFALVKAEHAERFLDLFGPDHRPYVQGDQARYAAAVQACTGTTPEVNAARLSREFLRYVQEPVTLARVTEETGYPEATILARLRKTQGLSHTLVQILAGLPVRRDQWERDFGTLMVLLSTAGPN